MKKANRLWGVMSRSVVRKHGQRGRGWKTGVIPSGWEFDSICTEKLGGNQAITEIFRSCYVRGSEMTVCTLCAHVLVPMQMDHHQRVLKFCIPSAVDSTQIVVMVCISDV